MAQLQLTLLGTFAAYWGGQPVPHFPTDKVRALLAYLALEGSQRPLRRETLATLLWPDYPDDIARRNLRQNLHRLNQLLDTLEPGLSDRLLLLDRQTAQLDPAYLWLDVTEFEAGLTAVETHPHRHLHACQSCLDTLAQAAQLARGDLLAGFTLPDAPFFDEWLIVRRERLHYQLLQLLHTLAEISLQRGEPDRAYDYAARQIALEPWREEAHRQMMLALARQGRRSEALAQYATCARLLEEEFGLPPSAETAALYQGILNEILPAAAAPIRLHHFPATFTPFIGREAECAQIAQWLQDPACRLLTLIAPGGMGKTRLVIAAAAQLTNAPQFQDGLYFVPLAAANDRDALLTALAQAVEMPLLGVGDMAAALQTFLKEKRLLLVLDNFEQLTAQAEVVLGLLTAVPHLHLLITSREPLNLQAEWQMRLDGLPYAPSGAADWADFPAAQLFIQVAGRVRPGFTPARHGADISRICELVGGMPLALEMAATWARLMEPAQIANQISDSLDFLVATARDAPERQRSVYAVLDQSWSLLEPEAQRVLAQLGLFQGGFSLDAAMFVSDATVSDLSALADKALLRPQLAGRYDLHPLLRQFTLERLAAYGPAFGATCRQRYTDYFLRRLADYGAEFHGVNAAAVLSAMQPDLDNVRQAWSWAAERQDAPLLVASQRGLARFFRLMGLHREGAALLAQSAARLAGREEWKTAVAHLQYREATMRLELGDYETAESLLRHAYATWEATGDTTNLSRALADLGIVTWRMGDLTAAQNYLQQSLSLAQQEGDGGQIGYALHHLGNIAWFRGEYATAVSLVGESLSYYRQQGDLRRLAAVLSDLGAAQILRGGDHEQSRAYFAESLALYRQLGDRLGVTYPLHNLGYLALMTGEYENAAQLFAETLQIGEQMGDKRAEANTLHHLGLTILLGGGDLEQAAAYFRAGLRLAAEIQERQVTGDALMGLAVTAVRQGNFHKAARLAGGMQARLGEFQIGGLIESPLYQTALTEARTTLGDPAFTASWAEGETWTLADVIAEGLHQ